MNVDPFFIAIGLIVFVLTGPYIAIIIYSKIKRPDAGHVDPQFAESLAENHFARGRFEPELLKNSENEKRYRKIWKDLYNKIIHTKNKNAS